MNSDGLIIRLELIGTKEAQEIINNIGASHSDTTAKENTLTKDSTIEH